MMTNVHDDTLASTVNIKLRAPSLTSLNIPLDTYVGFRSLLRNDRQKIIAGSVDLISEMSKQTDDTTLTRSSVSKPLTHFVSANKQLPVFSQEWRQVLKERFHASSSGITATSLTDSVARLRRTRQLTSMHQSSLQTIDNILERKYRFSFNYHGPLPKLTRRHLSFKTRTSSSIDQLEASSPFTSLPEIRSFSERSSADQTKKTNAQPAIPASSWEKSGSWSWKSSNASRLQSLVNQRHTPNMKLPRQVNHRSIRNPIPHSNHLDLPVIVESPLQQRSSLQTLAQSHPSSKPTNISHSNLSFLPERIRHLPQRLYYKRNLLPHAISNCDVSPNVFSCHPTTRYPSTPVLNHTRQFNLDQFDTPPLAIIDDDDDTNSVTDNSSFRSCVDSVTEISDDYHTDSSSSSSADSYFPDLPSDYHLPTKPRRLSARHLCTLQ